jgi:hypothetical protein
LVLAGAVACLVAGAPAPASADPAAREGAPAEGEPFRTAFSLAAVDKPGGLAFDGELLWVADRLEMQLVGVDPQSGEEKARVESPGTWPTGLAFDGELLWVADRARDRLFAVDLEQELVVRELPAPSGPLGMAFDGRYLWVSDGKQIHQVTTEDGTTIVSHSAPAWSGQGRGTQSLGLAFHEGTLWVSDRNRDRVYQVDPETGMVLDLMPSPGPFPSGLVSTGSGRLLLADVDSRAVDELRVDQMPATVRRDAREERVVLRRRLTNRGPDALKSADVWIALPHDAPNQQLHGEPELEPLPREIVEDQWGQRFAHFRVEELDAGEVFEVQMSVRATLYAVRHHIDPARVGSLDAIPSEVREYLQDDSKYAMDHPSIRRHLEDALQGETRPYWMARKIARYIQERMHYELVGGWNIAPTVIDRGSGSCSEYTFVFISMCRAAGIPARYVGSLVVRGDDASTDEVFHRWPEIYLPGYGWVPFDVQGGDEPVPGERGAALGSLPNRFLITTWGGGGSDVLGWDYNSTASWVCRGRCLVQDLHLGDWYPATSSESPQP